MSDQMSYDEAKSQIREVMSRFTTLLYPSEKEALRKAVEELQSAKLSSEESQRRADPTFTGVSNTSNVLGTNPPPVPNDRPSCHDLVMQDMLNRKILGQQRYHTLLQPDNGRDMLLDLYEELLDAVAYARGALYEKDGR